MYVEDFEFGLRLLFGIVVLVAGRNVFWLAIGVLGFLTGFDLAESWLVDAPRWWALAAGIGIGLIGLVAALLFQRLAFALGGFYAAAVLALIVTRHLGLADPVFLIVAAGCVGALVVIFVTDWAIIALTAMAGAAILVSAIPVDPIVRLLIFIPVAAAGLLVQRLEFLRARS